MRELLDVHYPEAALIRVVQCLDRRIDDKHKLIAEVAAWERQRNAAADRINWMFTTQNAREKLRRAYPVKESWPLCRDTSAASVFCARSSSLTMGMLNSFRSRLGKLMELKADEILERLKAIGLTPEDLERVLFGRRKDVYDVDKIRRLAAGISSSQYVDKHMLRTTRFTDTGVMMRQGAAIAPKQGLVAEFGVYSGSTIRALASLFGQQQKIFGFDSFEGLPENWQGLSGKGAFSANKVLPEVPSNVALIVGWFEETLPRWVKEHEGETFRFIHIDCDIYSSTRTIFDRCKKLIGPGTVIQFDEYFNYPYWEQHEHRAFQEFIAETQLAYRYVGMVRDHQQVLVQMLG